MLSLYNTLTKQKEVFTPLSPGTVLMYTCGPTVYDYIHIGNLRSYITADTLRRVLTQTGLLVHLVKNITDVGHLTADDLAQGDSGEDKIEKKARAEKKTPEEIIAFFTDYFFKTEAAMNILPAEKNPRATESISGMISLIEKLIASGHAYAIHGNVFFDVTSFAAYGKLSGNTLDKLKVGARLEEHPDKKNPWDFALWLKAPEGHLMHWPSPWSEGYPGWHIECSAMSLAALGTTLDIHTGGEDNIFPHHEAEIAQSECANEALFVRYWLHTRHLLVNGEKMSKSKGNFYKLEDIIEKGFSPMDLRMLFLGAHYRSQMNFTWEALEQAKKNRETLFTVLDRLHDFSEGTQNPTSFDGNASLARILDALQDDLNVPEALAETLELAKKVNTALDSHEPIRTSALRHTFETILFDAFGLIQEKTEIPIDVRELAEKRETARTKRDFATSDELRMKIEALGFFVEDVPGGFRLKKK